MQRRLILVVSLAVTLVVVGGLMARQGGTDPGGPAEGRRGGMGGRGMRPAFMGPEFDTWLDEIAAANEKSDKAQVGKLLADMKQSREQFRQGMRGPRPDGPPGGMPGGGPGGGFGMGGGRVLEMDNPTRAKDDAEKKILDVLDEMDRNQRRGNMNVPTADGRLLRLLTESTGAKHVVELGTSNGYSGIWFCLALRTTGGRLTTHEIDAGRASMARENFKKAGVEEIVTLVEGDAHENVKKIKGQIDIIFLDADKEGYIDYMEKLLALVRPGGLIIAHNMNPGQADTKYVEAITSNASLETLLLHEQTGGVTVTMKKR